MAKQKKPVSARQTFINHIIQVERYCNAGSTSNDPDTQKRKDEESASYAASIWDSASTIYETSKKE